MVPARPAAKSCLLRGGAFAGEAGHDEARRSFDPPRGNPRHAVLKANPRC